MNLREAAEVAMWTLESTGTDPSDPKQAIQYNRELKIIERLRRALDKPEREWVGLTDEEIKNNMGVVFSRGLEFAKAIEAKLKEKNG